MRVSFKMISSPLHFSWNSLKAGCPPFQRVPGLTLPPPLQQSLLQDPLSAPLLQLAQGGRGAMHRGASAVKTLLPPIPWVGELESRRVKAAGESLNSGQRAAESRLI